MSERSQTHATFVLERYYPVPVERVWDAFADPEMKRQWFGSGDLFGIAMTVKRSRDACDNTNWIDRRNPRDAKCSREAARSPTTHPQQAFRITITLNCDFRGRTVDFMDASSILNRCQTCTAGCRGD